MERHYFLGNGSFHTHLRLIYRKLLLLLLVFLHYNGAALANEAQSNAETITELNLAASKILFSNTDSSRTLAEKALGLCKGAQFDLEKANALHTLGLCNHIQGRYDSAIMNYQFAIELREGTKDQVKIAGLLNNIASIYASKGNYVRALSNYQKALSIKKEARDSTGIANTLNNIGIIHYESRDYERALSYYSEALELRLEMGLTADIAASYGNIGLVYQSLGDFQNSLRYYENGFHQLDSTIPMCKKLYILNGLGTANYSVGNIKEAEKYSQMAYDEATKCQDPTIKAMALNDLGKINAKKNRLELAEQQLKEAYQVAQNNQLTSKYPDLLNSLYQFYSDLGRFQKALRYFELYNVYRDSTESREVSNKITTMELTYEFQKEKDSLQFEQQKERLQFQSEAEKQQVKQRFTVVVLILVVCLAAILFWSYRNKRRINQELSSKNQIISEALAEKELLMREIHHRVKNNLQIINSMLNVQRKSIDDHTTQNALRDTQSRILAMALVHNSLYESNTIHQIEAENYLKELISSLEKAFDQNDLEVTCQIDPIVLSVDDGINIGLIVNELFTNTIKHAFHHSKQNNIKIQLLHQNEHLLLLVSDNGQGYEVADQKQSFGMNMIKSVVRSMKAEMTVKQNRGTTTEIKIPYEGESAFGRR